MSPRVLGKFLDLVIRLYRSGEVCPKCAAIIAVETARLVR